MKRALFSVTALLAGCAGLGQKDMSTDADRATFLATLPAEDRETFELYFWALEVDPEPIKDRFGNCLNDRIGRATGQEPAAIAEEALDECFPIVDPLIRGTAMRVSALATGVTAADMRYWSEHQVREQRAELLADLTKRIENNRAGVGRY